MSHTWQGSLDVNASLARSLINSQFPELAGRELAQLRAGWDHAVWRCGDIVFRFPHQTGSLDLARRSVQALQQLAPKLPLRIPIPTHQGTPTPAYPGHFVGYRWLAGWLPADLPLTTSDRTRAASTLAGFLHVLHKLEWAESRSWGVAAASDKGSMALRSEKARKRVQQLADTGWARLAADALQAMERPPAEALAGEACLVHGDLHAGQVLLDSNHNLAAVLDWDELAIGDPAFDLIMVYSFLPPSAREDFWRIYGSCKAAARARHLALSYGLAILVQAIHSHDEALREEAAFGLKNALAD